LVEYNAVLYSQAGAWINEEFAKENKLNKDISTREFIVKTKEEYDVIFKPDIEGLTVDFEHQMLVVYTLEDADKTVRFDLLKVTANDDVLEVTYKNYLNAVDLFGPPYGSACQPYQRWFVILLDKVDVDTVVFKFEEFKKYGIM
jgi:hypothetical protein